MRVTKGKAGMLKGMLEMACALWPGTPNTLILLYNA